MIYTCRYITFFRKIDADDENDYSASATKAYATNSPQSVAAEPIDVTSSSIKSEPPKKEFFRIIDDDDKCAEVENALPYDNTVSGSDVLMRGAGPQNNINESIANPSPTPQTKPKDLSIAPTKPNGLASSVTAASSTTVPTSQPNPTNLSTVASTKNSLVKGGTTCKSCK